MDLRNASKRAPGTHSKPVYRQVKNPIDNRWPPSLPPQYLSLGSPLLASLSPSSTSHLATNIGQVAVGITWLFFTYNILSPRRDVASFLPDQASLVEFGHFSPLIRNNSTSTCLFTGKISNSPWELKMSVLNARVQAPFPWGSSSLTRDSFELNRHPQWLQSQHLARGAQGGIWS